MGVRRITANVATGAPAECAAFYTALFDLEVAMNLGWIVTLQSPETKAPVQLSFAAEGGSGTEVPGLSIEVDDLAATLDRLAAHDVIPEYGPVEEPWGVRRVYIRDPAGTLLNILSHMNSQN